MFICCPLPFHFPLYITLYHSLFYLPVVTCTFLLKDLDKTQTEIMRHHTSISELKRSFMESVPEPRPSEWDKRLSTNSPFRTVSINGQFQPAVSPTPWGESTLQTHCFLLSKAGFSCIDFIRWLIQLCRLILCVVSQWLFVWNELRQCFFWAGITVHMH